MSSNTIDTFVPVMIVDDSKFMRDLPSIMLSMKGFLVVAEAADGNEAIVKYKQLIPRLIDVLL